MAFSLKKGLMATWPFWPFRRLRLQRQDRYRRLPKLLQGHPRLPGRHPGVQQDDARRSEQYLGASAVQLQHPLLRLRLEEGGRPAIQQAAVVPPKSAPQDVLATLYIARQRTSAYGACRNFVTRKRYEGIRLEGRCSEVAPRLL